MALQTLGTKTATRLQCLPAWSAVLAQADIAAIAQSIINDSQVASQLSGYGAGHTAVIGSGSTHTNTTLDTLLLLNGPAISQIQVGDLVLKPDIPLGTFVTAKPTATSVTLSQAATGSNSDYIVFARPHPPALAKAGLLTIPKRGVLQVLPGDIVAVDNTGWPILVPGSAITFFTSSAWTLT